MSGFDVLTFSSADDLLASHKWATADCIVLDVRLGQGSGLDLYRRLTASGLRSPVVFITAYDDAAIREQVLHAGAADFLPKPFDENCLTGAIKRALAHG